MTKRESPPLFMRAVSGGLEPTSAYDADLLADLPRGVDLEIIVKHRKRSLPQLRLYWKMLSEVVRATEKYPSSEILHEILKYEMGYTTPARLLDGTPILIPDSAAFDKMDAVEFRGFMDRAVKLLNEAHGFDCLAFMEAA